MANVTYVVKANDTLTSIAEAYGTTVNALVELNHIQNPNLIYVGQTLIISGAAEPVATNGKTVTITAFGRLVNETRKMFVTWEWSQADTDHYEVIWQCHYPDVDEWLENGGKTENIDIKESVFEVPSDADAVRVKITPVAKTTTVNGKEVAKWTGVSTSYERLTYYLNNEPPTKPSAAPTVSIEGDQLTAKITGIDGIGATGIEFEVVKDNKTVAYKATATIITDQASWKWTVERGYSYKVRCRGYVNSLYGEWSEYSNEVYSLPLIPSITDITVLSKASIMLTFQRVKNAKAYKVQYISNTDVKNSGMTPEEYFESGGAQIYSPSDYTDNSKEETGTIKWGINLDTTGDKFYIRMCATNNTTSSTNYEWSSISIFSVGTVPTAPTTWSIVSSALIGDELKLYWVHNSEDGSTQTGAQIQLKFNDENNAYLFIIGEEANTSTGWIPSDPDHKINYVRRNDPENNTDKTYVCSINTYNTKFNGGAKVQWRVRTSGVSENTEESDEIYAYGDWSVWRTFNVYVEASMILSLEDSNGVSLPNDGSQYQKLTSFPLCIRANISEATNQKPISYYVTVTANQNGEYESVDNTGNTKLIVKGTVVYSKYFDSNSAEMSNKELYVSLLANHINLSNNINYLVTCTASMDSGLRVEQTAEFQVSWEEESFTPFATISVDEESLAAYIHPFIQTEENVILSVYRREFDGSFTEIESNLPGVDTPYITDPHPSLDYARYRIIAKSVSTGAISFNDIPGYPVNEGCVVIQWDEEWRNFNDAEGVLVEQPWTGSMLKLPYNIAVSESNNPDVTLVEYIGREQPVSYYGTQLRNSLSISVDIDKKDKETLHALRRLQAWMGDVYIREPSGIGYWANVRVSLSTRYNSLVIPVTLNISRVEGGK